MYVSCLSSSNLKWEGQWANITLGKKQSSDSFDSGKVVLIYPVHHNTILHILDTILKVLTKKICLKIKSSLVGDHFFYSRDLNVWFRGDIIGRN